MAGHPSVASAVSDEMLIGVSSRRRAIVTVSPEILLHLCTMTEPTTVRVSANPLPEDVRLVGARYDVQRDLWLVVVESATFDEVGDGNTYPELPPPQFSRRWSPDLVLPTEVNGA